MKNLKKVLAVAMVLTILIGSTSGLLAHATTSIDVSTITVGSTNSDEPNPEKY